MDLDKFMMDAIDETIDCVREFSKAFLDLAEYSRVLSPTETAGFVRDLYDDLKDDPKAQDKLADIYAIYCMVEQLPKFKKLVDEVGQKTERYAKTQHPHWILTRDEEELMRELEQTSCPDAENSPWRM